MENASKALIIAGAILLAILLITLGIYIFQQAQSTVNNSGMSQAEVQSFNSQFIKYEGTSVKGSAVKSLVQEVNANNAQDETNNDHQITITGKTSGSGASATTDIPKASISGSRNQYLTSGIKNTQTYEVKITGYGTDGRVSAISITH